MIYEIEVEKKSSFFPTDSRFRKQRALLNYGQRGAKDGADTDAPEARDLFMGSPNIVAAVLDTGVNNTHGDLK